MGNHRERGSDPEGKSGQYGCGNDDAVDEIMERIADQDQPT
jgi:hypothetical protein